MRKLALNDEILLKIEKPARYIGNEVNSVMKNKNEVDEDEEDRFLFARAHAGAVSCRMQREVCQ